MSAAGTITEIGPFVAVTGYDDTIELWDALIAHYMNVRPVQLVASMSPRFYPETSIADVLMVAGLFSERLQKAAPDALGLPRARERWLAYQPEIQALIAGRLLHETFPDNARFWRETHQVAVYLSATYRIPTKADIIADALRGAGVVDASGDAGSSILGVVEAVVDNAEAMLGTGSQAAKKVAAGAGGAARTILGGLKDGLKSGVEGVGDAVIKPLVDLVGKPLLIGAAALGGLLIVPRLLDDSGRRKRS